MTKKIDPQLRLVFTSPCRTHELPQSLRRQVAELLAQMMSELIRPTINRSKNKETSDASEL